MEAPNQIVVAIGPPLGGKSTFCSHLPLFDQESFAEPIYRMIGELIGHDKVAKLRRENQKGDPLPELGGKSLREALQTLGTDWGRDSVYQNIWVDTALRKLQGRNRVAFDDLRFPNEYERMRELGAVFVRMLPYETLRKEGWEGHESESYWRTFKCHVQFQWDERQDIIDFAERFSASRYASLDPSI